MFSLESFHQEYETHTSDLAIKDRHFRFFVPKSLDEFIYPGDLFHDLPLCSKIWEASITSNSFCLASSLKTSPKYLLSSS